MCFMEKLKQVEKEIEKIIANSPCEEDPVHSKSVRNWVLKLKPDASEALQIAALAHDIDRGINGKEKIKNIDKFRWEQVKGIHGKRSAKIICDILKKYKYDKKIIDRVKYLVERHEVGGDEDAEVLKDADGISFFDYNVYFHFRDLGKEKTIEKIRYTFKRSSKKARQIIMNLKFKDPRIEQLFKEAVFNKK